MQFDIGTPNRPIIASILREYAKAFGEKRGTGNVEAALASDANARRFLKAASAPLGLPGDGSAALVSEHVFAYIRALPASVVGELARRCPNIDVSAGPVVVPGRDTSKSGGGSAGWVKPAAPVPVVRLDIEGVTLDERKVGSITILTRELVRNPAAGPVIERLQTEDVVQVMDSALLDGQPGNDSRPQSLLVGAVAVSSSGSLVDDLGALLAAVPYCSAPTLIMDNGFFLQCAAAGVVTNGTIAGCDVILTDHMPDDAPLVIYLDAGDTYITAGASFDVSHNDAATIHADNQPLPLIAQNAEGVAVASSPVISLYQMALVGVRVVLPVSWAARPGRVAFLQAA
ncbi:hypothetical protein [Cupriavidus metallidurans]|uniref:hypothetical protein n=1 Tax=Cupriavidus metallidurans TaxID=119219 RepID=UPI001646AEC2|nr:hypothetical protein [Cupriavidus metallidurans]